MPSLVESVKQVVQPRGRKEPLWKGPSGKGPLGGITFSMLNRFLGCRERFRLYSIEGLKAREGFNHRLEFGNMWHLCEEWYAGHTVPKEGWNGLPTGWAEDLKFYSAQLCKKHPLQQDEVDKWYRVVKVQFPIYIQHWAKHPDVVNRTPLLQEQVFDVPYRLPSDRVVRLRGKWDSVDLVSGGGPSQAALDGGIYLQENKTKGEVNEQQIKRQLSFDLQTMLYLVALTLVSANILGVRYNVIRRPLSGGKGTIVQKKGTDSTTCTNCHGTGITPKKGLMCTKCQGIGRLPGKLGESTDEYMERLAAYIREEPETYFFRWRVEVSPQDIMRFRRECLDPILEQLCDWWERIGDPELMRCLSPFDIRDDSGAVHYRHPFGCYNVLDEGGSTAYDDHLSHGSMVGLDRANTLFPELQGG